MENRLSTRLWSECRVALLWLAKSRRTHERPGAPKSTKGRCVMAASYRHIASSLLARLLPLLYDTDFFNHLNCYCPSVGRIKTENICSEAPFLKTKLPSQHCHIKQIHKYLMLQISILGRKHCIKQVNTACENHTVTRTTEPTQNKHMSPLTVKWPEA